MCYLEETVIVSTTKQFVRGSSCFDAKLFRLGDDFVFSVADVIQALSFNCLSLIELKKNTDSALLGMRIALQRDTRRPQK
jgi:hypothetical protein